MVSSRVVSIPQENMAQYIEMIITAERIGLASGWVGTKDASKHPVMYRTKPYNKVFQPKTQWYGQC